MMSRLHITRQLCNKKVVRHFLWYKIGNSSSSRLRCMGSGLSLLSSLDTLFTHAYYRKRHIVSKLSSKLNDFGSNMIAFRHLCEAVLCECQTESQLGSFAVMLLVVIVDMLEQSDQSDLNDKADHMSSILCESLTANIKLRHRKNLCMGLFMSCLTIGICMAIKSLCEIVCF